MKKRRQLTLILALTLLIALLAGCSASPNYDSMEGGNMAGMPESDKLNGSGNSNAGSADVLTDRKLIRKIQMQAETDDMDALLGNIGQRIAQLGGYIESRDIQNGSTYDSARYRYATLVIRIPAEKLDSFVEQVESESNIISTKETSDDVTLQYVATESRLKVLRTEEERLVTFLSEVKTVSEMLEIEKRLTQVQTEIESITSQLNTFDNLVSYGTVTLSITEVKVFTNVKEEEPTMWEKISEGFMESINGLLGVGEALLVFILGRSPYLILIGAIVAAVLLTIRGYENRKRKRRTPPTPPAQG